MKIAKKLLYNTLGITFTAVAITATVLVKVTHDLSEKSLREASVNKLIVLRDIKSKQIKQYFSNIQKQVVSFSNNENTLNAFKQIRNGYARIDASNEVKQKKYAAYINEFYSKEFKRDYRVKNGQLPAPNIDSSKFSHQARYLQFNYVVNNPNKLDKSVMLGVSDASSYDLAHKKNHPHMRQFARKFDYNDIILVDAKTANVIYSVNKEIDFGTNLKNGPLSKSSLARVFQQAIKTNSREMVSLSDFSTYIGTYDDMSSFVGSAIWDNNQIVGVMIFHVPSSLLNQLTTFSGDWKNIGLGDTGEVYIFGQDQKMRTMSRFFIENKEGYLKDMSTILSKTTVMRMSAKNTSVGLQPVDSIAAESAIKNKVGYAEYSDYRNVKVLGAFRPLNIRGLQWYILAEMNSSEAFENVVTLEKKLWFLTIIIGSIVAVFAMIVSSSLIGQISKPIVIFSGLVQGIAKSNDLTKRIKIDTKDELELMANSLNQLLASLQETFQETYLSSKQVESTMQGMLDKKDSGLNESIKDEGENIKELSNRLQRISRQFKIFEEESDKRSSW